MIYFDKSFVNNAIFSMKMIHVGFNQKRLKGDEGGGPGWEKGRSTPWIIVNKLNGRKE